MRFLPCWPLCALAIAACSPSSGDGDARARCEQQCDIEAECGLRSGDACLTQLCSDDGFIAPDDGTVTAFDIETAESTTCILDAEDCAAVVLCTCDDACARTDECLGSDDPTCSDTCATLAEQGPTATYSENRCKLESACDDLALCGASG